MFLFPEREPTVTIIEIRNGPFEVDRLDAGSAFVLTELGAVTEFAFYDYDKGEPGRPDMVFTGAHQNTVAHRIRVDDFEMLVIESRYAEAGSDYSASPVYWNRVISEGGLRDRVQFDTHGLGASVYRSGTSKSPPNHLYPGLRSEGMEPVFLTGKEPEKSVRYTTEVVGACDVTIGPKSYRCLRVRNAFWYEDAPVLSEEYISDAGRTIYFRRYNGPGYRNYEELAGRQPLMHAGIEWRHYYNCIPDHALIIGR